MKKKNIVLMTGAIVCSLFILNPALSAKGKIEFSFHYGQWSLNPLKPMIESLAESFAEQVKNYQMDEIQREHPEFKEIEFTNDVQFDSGGKNYGFEVRWYPGGENGSFSLGLSLERTTMRISLPNVSTSLVVEDTASQKRAGFQAEANAEIKSEPLVFVLSLRWDIIPKGFIHPYFTLGFGMASLSAIDETLLTYNYEGVLKVPGEADEVFSGSDSKTVAQLIEEDRKRKEEEGSTEEPFQYPIKFFPFIQLHLGLKVKITSFLHAMVDYGIFDGFLIRGGIAIRI